jgi:hypothetical protein
MGRGEAALIGRDAAGRVAPNPPIRAPRVRARAPFAAVCSALASGIKIMQLYYV